MSYYRLYTILCYMIILLYYDIVLLLLLLFWLLLFWIYNFWDIHFLRCKAGDSQEEAEPGKLGGSGYCTGPGNGVFRILDFTVENHDLTWPVLQIAKHEIRSHVDVGSCWIMLAGRSESWLHLAWLGWRLCFLIHGPPCLAETSVTALK